jgi:thioredoxin-like negative regulator of GroEL
MRRAAPWLACLFALSLASAGGYAAEEPKPAEGEQPPAAAPQPPRITWAPDLTTALARAAKDDKLVLVKFSTPTCPYCIQLDREVLSLYEVIRAINRGFVAVTVNPEGTAAQQEITKHLRVEAWPTVVFLDSRARDVSRFRGVPNEAQILKELETAQKKHEKAEQERREAAAENR